MKDFWIKTQLKIGLWQVKIKRNVKKYKWILIAIGILVLVGIATAAILHNYYNDNNYFYIDCDGNRGTAYKCMVVDQGLVCERHNGAVMVQQYWR